MCFSLSLKVKMIIPLHVCCMHGYTGCEALRGETWRCLNSLYSVLSSVRNQQHMSFVPWLTTRTFCLQRVQDCQPELKKKKKKNDLRRHGCLCQETLLKNATKTFWVSNHFLLFWSGTCSSWNVRRRCLCWCRVTGTASSTCWQRRWRWTPLRELHSAKFFSIHL